MFEQTFLSLLRSLAAREPEKRLIGGPAGWLTAAQVLDRAEGLGRAFAELGLRPGDSVALRATRCAETALVIFGLRAAGVTVILTCPKQEIDEVLSECEADLRPKARLELAPAGCTLRLEGRTVTLALDAAHGDAPLPEVPNTEPAFVIFTSGSTGKSKAVVHAERSFVTNLLDTLPLGLYSTSDIALGAIPLEHIFGLVLLAGIAVLEYSIFFPAQTDLNAILHCIQDEGITRMNGVPSLYLAMAERAADFDLSSLRAGLIAGGPVTEEQFVHIEKTLDVTLISVYGMSECIGITCSSWRDPQAVRAAGVGPVYPLNEIRLVDAAGDEVPQGQEGEICVRSPMRMLGYWGKPLPAAEFFPTGDLGWLDESGVLHLSGRKKDIIIRNGNNLSTRRIEDALVRLPGVKAAAVVDLPHPRQGEVPCAMIVGQASPEELLPLLHKNELPEAIVTVEALPMTESGKPDKQRIREMLLNRTGDGSLS